MEDWGLNGVTKDRLLWQFQLLYVLPALDVFKKGILEYSCVTFSICLVHFFYSIAVSDNVSLDMCPQQRFSSACTVWSEFSLGTFWIARDAKFLHADNKEIDLTARLRILIWFFLGAHV